MHAEQFLEPSIRHIGLTLAEHCKAGTPAVLSQRWWNDLLMDWGMQDEDFKVQLFRFVDVLPTLKTDEQFTRLLAEYFSHTPILPRTLKWSCRSFPSPGSAPTSAPSCCAGNSRAWPIRSSPETPYTTRCRS